MNVAQIHERLRLEIARRIDRGLLTGTVLARQTGLQSSHISNFLHRKRKLSLAAIDRILAAQILSVEDLLPARHARAGEAPLGSSEDTIDSVPLVSQAIAANSPSVSAASSVEMIQLPAGILDQLRPGGRSFAGIGSAFWPFALPLHRRDLWSRYWRLTLLL